MTEGSITTRITPISSNIANKYKAHVLLTENRELSKEEAVNELIELAARDALPQEIVKALGLGKTQKKQ